MILKQGKNYLEFGSSRKNYDGKEITEGSGINERTDEKVF